MFSAQAAPLSSGLHGLAMDSSQSRQVRPEAASWANRLRARWWQWSGKSLWASHLVYWPETIAMYWPRELDRVNEWSFVSQAPWGFTVPTRNGACTLLICS